ncbi:MAG TPA: hypothetical protein VNH11_33825 [Pirellulales bacterium]|nr:hypothetical protein [Pirellulales bacterium]
MIPTPRDILIGRMLVHRTRGEYDVAAVLRHEIKTRDKGEGWTMPPDECPGELRSLVDLGFSLFACRVFEQHGVVYAGDLAQWSEAQLRSVTHLGRPRMVKKVHDVLRACGLRLRDPQPGERPPRRAPLARWLERRRRRRFKRRSERRRRQIEYLLSKNVAEREIARRFGYRSHTPVWAVKRAMRKVAGTLRVPQPSAATRPTGEDMVFGGWPSQAVQ